MRKTAPGSSLPELTPPVGCDVVIGLLVPAGLTVLGRFGTPAGLHF
jgi:hypothetical protein